MAVITIQELQEAAIDAGTVEAFSNGVPAMVTPRYGAQFPNMPKLVFDFTAAFNAAQDNKQFVFDASQVWRQAIFDATQTQHELDFAAFLEASGYETPIPYTAGIVLDRTTKTVSYLGNEYRAKGSFIPFTTTNWATDEAKLKLIGDDSLRQDLNSLDVTKGAAQIARSVVHVETLASLMLQNRSGNRLYKTLAYFPGSMALKNPDTAGGKHFLWVSTMEKSSHNGGTVIDPDRASTFPTDWSNDAQKAAWYAGSASGLGCFVATDCSTVYLEEFGATLQYDSTRAMQAAFNTEKTVSYRVGALFSSTVTIDKWGQVFNAPRDTGQYLGPRLEYNGAAGTYAIHVRAPGCAIIGHDIRRTGVSGSFCVLAFRNQEMIPANADIDLTFRNNNVINFATGIECVGRNVNIRGNLFSGYSNSAVLLRQFIYTSGTPEYWQTIERGYRGFVIIDNRFHASVANSITNNAPGHENLYGCTIAINTHDTDGKFFAGSLRQSDVVSNQLHRLSSLPAIAGCFYLETCRDVNFVGNMVGGESDPTGSAVMPAFVFRFATKNVSNVNISGGVWNNILGTPVVHIEPPDGIMNISGVSCRNVAFSVASGTSPVAPFVDVRNDSGDGRGVIGYNINGVSLELAAPGSTGTYLAVIRFAVRGAANSNVNVKFTSNRALVPHNLAVSKQTDKKTVAYVGTGSASQSISFGYAVAYAQICVLTPGAANFGKMLQLVPGTGAANTLAQLTETGVDVKLEFNTSGVVYSIVAQ